MPAKHKAKNSAFRALPSVDELLRSRSAMEIAKKTGAAHAADLARAAIASVRQELEEMSDLTRDELLLRTENAMSTAWTSEQLGGVKRVINATGVIIHTNLGRAPLSVAAQRAVDEASGYCTLEYDLETGKRGRRGRRVEDLLIELTGAEDALVVNNCAAAAFFILTVFASGGEVVISRGEMVEIGGDFRVPDVLEQSRATLREVGTTNRTKLADYEKAIGKDTRLLLRVHPSNYRIVGFTATPSVPDLAGLAKKHGLLLYEDLGSGALIDLSGYGLSDEPVVSRSIADGADIVSFSGDKLLGGPQAGIIAGRRDLIERLRKDPLQRALRLDKLAFAALEATLDAYRRGHPVDEIPVLTQLGASYDQISRRANDLVKKIGEVSGLGIEVIDGTSVVGGGAAPDVRPKTALVAIAHNDLSSELIERKFRMSDPPVITRIDNDRVVIDLRTVDPIDEKGLVSVINSLS